MMRAIVLNRTANIMIENVVSDVTYLKKVLDVKIEKSVGREVPELANPLPIQVFQA